jgi:hypothetical protein
MVFNTSNLTQAYTSHIRVTADTSKRLHDLGLEAAKAAAIPVGDLTVETKPDASGVPAHFFKYAIGSTEMRATAQQ